MRQPLSLLLLRIFLLFQCYNLCFANNQQQTLSFEIHRQTTPFQHYLNHADKLNELKFFQNEFEKAPRDNDSIALYRFLNDEFYGKIVIGHPGQTLNVAFDTSWDISWVMSSKCSSINMIGCWFHNKYDHTKSSEYKEDGRPFALDIGTYNLTGFYSYDNISIAHSNVTAQSFVEMVRVPYTFMFSKADGVLGLGLKTYDYNPFFYNLLKQKKIKNPIFSIYLNRDRQSNRGGNIDMGFINDKHIHKVVVNNASVPENITYLKVDTKAPYWQFTIDKITVLADKPSDRKTVCKNSCNAIVDTSSNVIVGPKDDVDVIHDVIKAREFFLNRYTVNCDTVNKLPKINLVMAGQNFTLKGEEYTEKMSYREITLCLSVFTPANTIQEQTRWVLGGAFLSAYYSIYNVHDGLIGFVKAQ